MSAKVDETSYTEIIITRFINAPRDLVWRAWTEAEHIAQWWGPKGFKTRVELHDFRVGGASRYVMVGPNGKEYPAEGVFKEIDPPNRFVSTDEFADDYQPPEGVTMPTGVILTVSFDEVEDGTRVTLRIAHPTEEMRKQHEDLGVVGGWNSSIDDLERYLPELKDA